MNPARPRKLSIAKLGLAVVAISAGGAVAPDRVFATDRNLAQDAGSPAPPGADAPPPPPPSLSAEAPPATAPADLSTLPPPPPDSLKDAGKAEDEAAKAAAEEKPPEELPPDASKGDTVSSEPAQTEPPRLSQSISEYDPRIPPYYYYKPQWAVGLFYAPRAFGDVSTVIRGASIVFEYQPRFLQKIGVIGLGPVFSVYPITSPSWNLNAWSVGGIVRYQARWFQNQWLVPTLGFSFDRITYNVKTPPSVTTTESGPVFGLMFLLNAIDPDTAAQSFVEPGFVRSYVFAELKRPTSSDVLLANQGNVWQFGLRIEF